MSAVGRDGNDQMYSIAWAIVEGENNLTWEWFLRQLQRSLDLVEGDDMGVVYDEHQVYSTIPPSFSNFIFLV